jgi:hypothetical protein
MPRTSAEDTVLNTTQVQQPASGDNCYVVGTIPEARNVEFVQSHKLQIGTTEARLVLFKYERTMLPLQLEYAKSVHAIKKDGLLKARCLATYDPFKKEWRTRMDCDYADIDSEFLDTRLEQGYELTK